MAVAVKNSPETATSSPFDRLPVISLVGVVYVVASLAIVFKLIPALWNQIWGGLGLSTTSFGSMTLMALVMLAGATALVILGARLLGPRPAAGVKAGIFVALMAVLLVLLRRRAILSRAEIAALCAASVVRVVCRGGGGAEPAGLSVNECAGLLYR